MTEKQLKRLPSSRMDTMESSRGYNQVELNYYQMSILNQAIEYSHVLDSTLSKEELNPFRYMFCLEYFFSIFNECNYFTCLINFSPQNERKRNYLFHNKERKINNTERFMIFDKESTVHISVLINFITEYKREGGELYRRQKVMISTDSVIEDMDKKVLITINKIWNQCHDQRFQALPRNNVQQLIERIYTDFNYKKTDGIIYQIIQNWRDDLSYFIIFEEFAFLMRILNDTKKLKISKNIQSCGGCQIF